MTTRGFPLILVLLTALGGLLPHPANITPIGALGLFAGACVTPRYAWFVPVGALLTANLVGGFYDPVVMLCVYIGMSGGPLFGRLLLSDRRNVARYSGALAGSAMTFYLISNFGVWLAGMYPPTMSGLFECYVNGLPFLARSMLGDALYCVILFGGLELAKGTLKRHAV